MEAEQRDFRILVFPWLAHGHVFPYLELAKNLSTKNFTIYFCSTPINLTSIKDHLQKTSFGTSKIELVEFNMPSSPDLPPHYHTTKNIPPHLSPTLFQTFHNSKPIFSQILTKIKPDLLIFDAFQTWAAKQASSLGIPAVHFATSGAASYSFIHHFFMHKGLPFPYQDMYLRDHEKKAMQTLDASNMIDVNDQDSGFDHLRLSSEIVLMKSCRGIEGKYIDYFSQLIKKEIVPVGALVSQPDDKKVSHSYIIQWLDKKESFSTVYISFGSENYFSKDQIEEIAKGLELCDDHINFIWVLRSPVGDCINLDEALPMGFLDKVKDRGMIVEGWAPQAKILDHPTIGAFVSHCGMSSIFESICFGIPIVAIPLKLDQPLNARLVVETGVGIEVEKDENGVFKREGVANAINEVVMGKSREEMRLKASELSKKMRSEEEQAMDEAAERLKRICIKYKQRK